MGGLRVVLLLRGAPFGSLYCFSMDVLMFFLVLVAVILSVVGIVGAIVPALPGPPLNLAALLIAFFVLPDGVSSSLLLWMVMLTLVVTGIDYVAPVWLTKLGGGSREAMWGSTLGIVVGLLLMGVVPLSLILCPLAGAFLGEMMHQSDTNKAIKVAFFSLLSVLLTSGLKLIACVVMTYYTLAAFYHYWF